jgi:hypothetical protein
MEPEHVATASIHANDYLYEARNCECKGMALRYVMQKP